MSAADAAGGGCLCGCECLSHAAVSMQLVLSWSE